MMTEELMKLFITAEIEDVIVVEYENEFEGDDSIPNGIHSWKRPTLGRGYEVRIKLDELGSVDDRKYIPESFEGETDGCRWLAERRSPLTKTSKEVCFFVTELN